MSLLQLPDTLLQSVLQCCAGNEPASWANAARAHSKLHQAAVQALHSITADVQDSGQLDSLLLYLEKHGQHVDSIHLISDMEFEMDEEVCGSGLPVTLGMLPINLQLLSLQCKKLGLQLQEKGPHSWPTRQKKTPAQRRADKRAKQQAESLRKRFQRVLQAGAPLQKLHLDECLLQDQEDGDEVLAAALAELPPLEHLCIDGCKVVDHGGYVREFHCATGMFEQLTQLTYLELGGVRLHPWKDMWDYTDAGEEPPGPDNPQKPNLQALTCLVDLRLSSSGGDSVSAEMLSGLSKLTRLELLGFEDFDACVLADKTLLHHLRLPYMRCHQHEGDAGTGALLSQLQPLQQLTYLCLRASLHVYKDGDPPVAAFSALTASSNLQHLDIGYCSMSKGAWQHILPSGSQLAQLRSLNICSPVGSWEDSLKRCPSGSEGSRLVSCCPGLRSLNICGLRPSAELLAALKGLSGLHVSTEYAKY